MTTDQRNMLFRLFAELCRATARKTAEAKDALRDEITESVFGEVRSWSSFGNAEVDRMKARLVADLNPGDLAAQMADSAEGGAAAARGRLLFRIAEIMARGGFHDGYARKISTALYDAADWRELPLPQLENLRNTLAKNAGGKGRNA